MDAFFRGRFEAKIDQKARATLPVAFRSVLLDAQTHQAHQTHQENRLVITNSQYKNRRCLDVYSLSAWQKLEKKIASLPQLNAEVQAFQRFYLSGAQVVEMDAQRRILVPPSLRKYAHLESEIVMVGMGDKFEIWDQTSWTELHESLAQNYEAILAGVASLEEKKSEKS